jgi:hypothetical protein
MRKIIKNDLLYYFLIILAFCLIKKYKKSFLILGIKNETKKIN